MPSRSLWLLVFCTVLFCPARSWAVCEFTPNFQFCKRIPPDKFIGNDFDDLTDKLDAHTHTGGIDGAALTDASIPNNITVSNYLPLDGSVPMTGTLILDNLGMQGTASDTNPSCTADTFSIYVDLSENTWKICTDGTLSDLPGAGGGGAGDIEDVGFCSTGACGVEGGNDIFPFIYEGTPDGAEIQFLVGDPIIDSAITFPANVTGVVSLLDQTISTSEIVDEAITEVKLDAIDTAGDEECLTFETDSGRFEWQACGGGGGSGDITDVYNCPSGDCASITMADGDLLDASGVNPNTAAEGIILPQATDCSGATAAGQLCNDSDQDVLTIGFGTGVKSIGRAYGKQLPPHDWTPELTNGPNITTVDETNFDYLAIDFNATTQECAITQFSFHTDHVDTLISFRVHWTATGGAAAQTIELDFSVYCRANDEVIDAAPTSTYSVTDTWIANGDDHFATSGAGAAHNCAPNEIMIIKMCRDVAADNLAGDLRVLNVDVQGAL